MAKKLRVYLDMQIFDQCAKHSDMKTFFAKQDCDFYCSVAHCEELHRSLKNDLPQKLHSNQLVKTVEELCVSGVLNPAYSGGIQLKAETVQDAIQRCLKYDTETIVKKHAEILNDQKWLGQDLSDAYLRSTEQWEKIWEEDAVKQSILRRNTSADGIDLLDQAVELGKIYKLPEDLAIRRCVSGVCHIKRGNYSELQGTFPKLEYTIEQLARVLNEVGFRREKNVRTYNSGEYDISHMIYATYCDCFATADRKLGEKIRAIYSFLSVPTEVKILQNFQQFIEQFSP